MPISSFLQNGAFDPDMTHAMGIAFDNVCRALGLTYTNDGAKEVAERVIEVARTGERDPDRICAAVLQTYKPAA